jgi:hypothetical protein
LKTHFPKSSPRSDRISDIFQNVKKLLGINGVFHAYYGCRYNNRRLFLASKMGLITGNPPVVYWTSAVLVIAITMIVLGLGIILPTNLRVYFELRKNQSDMSRFRKLMKDT